MLPKTLKYQSKVESAMAQSYRTNIAPQNGTGPYPLGSNIIINIPTSNNLVLATTESYLKFGLYLTASNANVFRLDSCGAHGLIQRIRVFHGSNLLQDIDNYGLMAKMFFDLQQSTDACYGRQNELVGTRNDLVSSAATGAVFAANTTTYSSCNQINSGEGFNFAAGGAVSVAGNNCNTVITAAIPRYFCLNLISILGSLNSQNYFALFACTSAPIRLEIQLVAGIVNAGMDVLGTTVASLNNVEYIANFIKLSDTAMSMIQSSLEGQPLQFTVPDYSNYQHTATLQNAAGSTQVNFSIPAKYSSLKSIFVMVRDQGIGAAAFYPYSTVTAGLNSYYFRVGSSIMPTKAPDNLPEIFAECLKAMGSMSDLNWQPSIEKMSYETVTSGTAINTGCTIANNGYVSSGSFYIGLDLENYVSAPKDSIFCGYNSNTDDIFCVLNFNWAAAPGAVINMRFDAFAMFDSVIVCDNNVCFRKF